MREPLRVAIRRLSHDQSGSAVVEFTLVSVLIVTLVVAVLQLALVLHVRNTVQAAAAEGARVAALADGSAADGIERARQLIVASVGESYAEDISVENARFAGLPAVAVRVRAPLPLAGLLGPGRSLEVVGHAALEPLER